MHEHEHEHEHLHDMNTNMNMDMDRDMDMDTEMEWTKAWRYKDIIKLSIGKRSYLSKLNTHWLIFMYSILMLCQTLLGLTAVDMIAVYADVKENNQCVETWQYHWFLGILARQMPKAGFTFLSWWCPFKIK
jgi:hypothetical protein